MLTATGASASDARPTDTGVDGGWDVDVELELSDGRVLSGEVTLRRHGGCGQWADWGGSPDYWVSGALLVALRQSMTRSALDEACAMMSATAGILLDQVRP